ncbi:MAG: 3-deoxy-7-phosphoheptulonate synthase [Candidatus Gastranaerophilales bacterium]|nr:3-deoxy-7-phosphoheptulonate synthase [Candidatus Gastranaerophilales bacterium]MCM1073533.1 3-deoxy-7-phosphoheptulonate synthase [Bacteroides sp.]
MLVVMNKNATDEDIQRVSEFLESKGFEARVSHGEVRILVHAIGVKDVDQRDFELLPGVNEVLRVSTSYKLAARISQGQDTVIEVNGVKFGDKYTGLIAGPCTIESYNQMDATAQELKDSNVKIIRGGAFKPRTSPYAFQGMGEEGLKIIRSVADNHGMAVTSEIMDASQLDIFMKYVDILQVGARNMQNFNLLKELGKVHRPVILKRGLSATYEEWLMSAEYIMAGGNNQVILCERGIRTFEKYTRNTLDLSAIPVIKKLSHLPIIIDPSHATGLRDKVEPMSRAAIAAGCDGLIIEVHHNPECAMCDGAQSLYPWQYDLLYKQIKQIAPIIGKEIL